MSAPVLSAGDRIRAIVQLGREAREADAEIEIAWIEGGADAADAVVTRFDEAVTAMTDHLAALEATGVLESLAEAADLFEAGAA